MNCILVFLFLIIHQNEANDYNSQKIRNIHESFDINIGAGYAVGPDQSTNTNPPNGTSNISLSKNFYPKSLKAKHMPNTTIRGPRILTNFTPQIENPFLGQPRNYTESQTHVSESHHKDHYAAAPSNIQNYNSPNFLTPPDEHSSRPNLVDFQKVLDKIEAKKPYSKVVQVIKVPAIYEIHLQSDKDDDISKNQISLNPTGDLFWKNYFENKPNISIKYSEDYSKWLETNNMQRQESFTKDGEKYYDFSDTPVVTYENFAENSKPYDPVVTYENYADNKPYEPLVTYENYAENKPYDDKVEENDILPPIINHHYNHIRNPANNFRSDNEVKINYNSDSSNKLTSQTKDYPYRKRPYGVNNLKKQVFYNSYHPYRPIPTTKPFHQDVSNGHSTDVRNSGPFKHNYVITENDKPQALHEVPPPLLGRDPHTKHFEIQKVSKTVSHPKILPTPSTFDTHTKVKLNKFPTPTTKPIKHKIANSLTDSKLTYTSGKKNKIIKPEVVPSSGQFASYIKANQNLIYGTKSERVLTPYEMNIPVTPGSTMVTMAKELDNTIQNSVHNFHYSSAKGNMNPASLEQPDIINNKHNHYHKQITDKPQHNAKQDIQSFQQKNGINYFNPQSGYKTNIPQKDANNVLQSLLHSIGNNTVNSPTSEKPEILTNEFSSHYQGVVDMPYRTQKSITDIPTTQSSLSSFLPSNSFTISTVKYANDQNLAHIENKDSKDNGEDKNMAVSGSPTFRSKEDSRRRTFNLGNFLDYNSFTKGLYGYLKNEEQPRPHQRKNNDADYIIYITRKAID